MALKTVRQTKKNEDDGSNTLIGFIQKLDGALVFVGTFGFVVRLLLGEIII